ncbi:MAG: IS1-like element transposase [Bacteroidia bacterium]|nr:IS1-like element transposase [Bacteroidia bacterium]
MNNFRNICIMVEQTIACRYCGEHNVIYAGKNSAGNQRCKCKDCKRIFLLTYTHRACAPGVREQILEMAKNASGVRDTSRVLQVSRNTVTAVRKKKGHREVL